MDSLHPDEANKVREEQETQKLYYDVRASPIALGICNEVYALNFCNGPHWLSGHITAHVGSVSWVIEISDRRYIHRYQNEVPLQYQEVLPVENSHSDFEVPGFTES